MFREPYYFYNLIPILQMRKLVLKQERDINGSLPSREYPRQR